jgi:Alcohol dehydrogenase GroES-like domain
VRPSRSSVSRTAHSGSKRSTSTPGSGEVLVQIVATGICHTDGLARHGDLPFRLPGVLGHEGAGKGSLLQGFCSLYDAADPWDHDSDPWDGHYGSDPPTFSTRRLDRNRI